jgi:hypothetical protein
MIIFNYIVEIEEHLKVGNKDEEWLLEDLGRVTTDCICVNLHK